MSKTCLSCRIEKAATEFNKANKKPDGLQQYCRACSRLKYGKWYGDNRETRCAVQRDYYSKHSDYYLHCMGVWREANREYHRAKSREWQKLNPVKRTELIAAYRARKRQACPPWADKKAILGVYEKAASLSKETGLPHEVDHIFPLAGKDVCGLHVAENLQVITASSNRKKYNKLGLEE